MKSVKITYWVTTSFIAVVMAYSAYLYLTAESVQQGFQHLGFPDYFRVELAIAKLIGAVLLLVPVANSIKEWVYLGFAITFISAFIAHTAQNDPITNRIGPVVFLVLLIVSYITYRKLNQSINNSESVHHAVNTIAK